MTASKRSSERKTIGILSAQLNRMWGGEFMSGVLEAAEAADVNVVSFVGGQPIAISADHGRPSYGLYDLPRRGRFDGFILAADIGYGLSPEEIKAFCKSFAPAPIVSYAVQGEGITTFLADNTGGMRTTIRHLIEEHGYKRIAFIRGLSGQLESEERFEAYRLELKAHDLRFDEKLVVDGDYTSESGRAAVYTLLDERGIRIQAIAAANDRMAFGALEALQQRGIRVPDSIALTGFDDVREAQSMGVPLTTVHQSFYGAGRKVFEALMKRINGEHVEPVTVLPTQMVVRWSCGCLPESVKMTVVLPKEVAQTGQLQKKPNTVIQALFSAAEISENDRAAVQYRDVFGRTWDVFLASLHETDTGNAFLKMVQATVEVLQRNGYGPTVWHNFLSTFRKYALAGITRMLVGELSQRAQAYRRLQLEQREDVLGGFSFSIAPAMKLEEIGEAISKHFPAMGIKRWYVMFYSDVSAPGSISSPPPESYRLLMQYDENTFRIPSEKSSIATGRLLPRGKTPENRRYTVMVMPLSLARNRFGFMWTEMGSTEWDIYVRIRNLLSSALLRTMLAQQREQAQKEVERLLNEARERAVELAKARDQAEKAAAQNAKLFESEKTRRRSAEALARSSRHLSALTTVEQLPAQILQQLHQILPNDRAMLIIEDINGRPAISAQIGLPEDIQHSELRLKVHGEDLYKTVARKGETLLISDVTSMPDWEQPEWLPHDKSWLGVPLYSKDNVIGMLALSRADSAFDEDDALLATTFAMQATVALENERLYREVTEFNQLMERMVAERVEELNNAYRTLEKHDKNKSAFIQVAAHELRTPLTVIKGYLGMLKGDTAVRANPMLAQAVEGVTSGTNRLQQVVTSMLDVARLENQIVTPHIEAVSLGPIVRLIQKDYVEDLTHRNLTLNLDESIRTLPPLLADPELLKKALDHVIVNAIKFTPDGGSITIAAEVINDEKLGACGQICVKDTGIGIDPANHKIIFDKLHQLGKVELHSSSRTNFKGGGAGLGLAIAAGIVKALQGHIWVESPGYDEEKLPGSTFFVRIPLVKEK